MTDQRQRIAAALCDANPLLAGYSRRVEEYTDAVLAVVRAELASAYNEFGKALETEAANCAREIDRAKQAEAAVQRVESEIVRIVGLETVAPRDDERCDSFAVGARWTLRLIRAALDGPGADQHTTTEGDTP